MMKNKRRDKRGVSGVIGVVILIAIVMAAAILVWFVIKNMIEGRLKGTACVDAYEQIELNTGYTCFESGTDPNVTFSIIRKDMDISKIVVLISGGGSTKSFTFDSTGVDSADIEPYIIGGPLTLPDKNAGLTYRYNGTDFSSAPDSIEIAPVIDDKQCEATDSITDIPLCSELGL